MENVFYDSVTGELKTLEVTSRFDSSFDFTPRNDAEINSGEYIVDDTDYMDLSVLIERTKRNNPRLYNDIKSGVYADNVIIKDKNDLDNYLSDMTNSGVSDEEDYPLDNGDSVAADVAPQEAQSAGGEAVNPPVSTIETVEDKTK